MRELPKEEIRLMEFEMKHLISIYKQRLNLQSAIFSRIDHEDAMVADVYKISQPNGIQLILKICECRSFLREVYFLKLFSGQLPVPRIIDVVEPESGTFGAILMEFLPGKLLEKTDFTDSLAYEIGQILARIHLNTAAGYGDLIKPEEFSADPRLHFNQKFEEGFSECSNNLPKALLEQCRRYYNTHIDLLTNVDGPCIVHRDFRPGNIIVYKGELQGIIDWASARASFSQEDFCSMEHGEWPTSSNSKKSFLEGYESIRPIPDYNAMMPLLRLSKAIATIGFIVKRGTWQTKNVRLYAFNRQFLETFF